MPIWMPPAEMIRHRIAGKAAELANRSLDHFLSLLGEVEPVSPGTGSDGSSWRLASHFGSVDDIATIHRAVALIQREHPLIRATCAERASPLAPSTFSARN